MKTSIIIPTYNGKPLLKNCLYAIKVWTDAPYEVIVVDDASDDGTLDFCLGERVVLVSLPHNRGFPAACNAGLKIASGDNIVILNNDVQVRPHWLGNLLKCLHSSDDIGIVGPLTNYVSGSQRVDYKSIDENSSFFNLSNPQKWRQTERLVGFCLAMKREVPERIGLFDERFSPGHYEDDDYCYRARIAGYRLMIAGDTFVYHEGGKSFDRKEKEALASLIETNRNAFIAKWGFDPVIFIH